MPRFFREIDARVACGTVGSRAEFSVGPAAFLIRDYACEGVCCSGNFDCLFIVSGNRSSPAAKSRQRGRLLTGTMYQERRVKTQNRFDQEKESPVRAEYWKPSSYSLYILVGSAWVFDTSLVANPTIFCKNLYPHPISLRNLRNKGRGPAMPAMRNHYLR